MRNATHRTPRSYPPEFDRLLRDQSENFVGRQFVLAALDRFLQTSDRGYFTLVGAPGCGKSAILAHFVYHHPHAFYYSAEVAGKNRAEQFLGTICQQFWAELNHRRPSEFPEHGLPESATEGSGLLSLLLQKLSDLREPEERILIVLDGLDRVDANESPLGSNLFYLPRYLPQGVYFCLARRPFVKEKSGLLIETPSQLFDLDSHPESEADLREYLQQVVAEGENFAGVREWVNSQQINWAEFCDRLVNLCQNNYMVLTQLLTAIAEGFYPQAVESDRLPPGLLAYYQQHWQKISGEGLSPLQFATLRHLAQQPAPQSAEAIATAIDADEYDVEKTLENWREFLQVREIEGELRYDLYHPGAIRSRTSGG